jgi:uncharacterized membrane protein
VEHFLVALTRAGVRVFGALAIAVLAVSSCRTRGTDRIVRDTFGFETTVIGVSAAVLIVVLLLSILSVACWLATRRSGNEE